MNIKKFNFQDKDRPANFVSHQRPGHVAVCAEQRPRNATLQLELQHLRPGRRHCAPRQWQQLWPLHLVCDQQWRLDAFQRSHGEGGVTRYGRRLQALHPVLHQAGGIEWQQGDIMRFDF